MQNTQKIVLCLFLFGFVDANTVCYWNFDNLLYWHIICYLQQTWISTDFPTCYWRRSCTTGSTTGVWGASFKLRFLWDNTRWMQWTATSLRFKMHGHAQTVNTHWRPSDARTHYWKNTTSATSAHRIERHDSRNVPVFSAGCAKRSRWWCCSSDKKTAAPTTQRHHNKLIKKNLSWICVRSWIQRSLGNCRQ